MPLLRACAALSEEYDEGVGAPVLVAETPVRVQWATPPAAAGGVDGAGDAAAGGAMLPPPHGGLGLSKQEQLDYAVVRPSRAPRACHPARP